MATEMDNKMNEFFQAIDEGRITHEEIIRRLENGIEAEYLKGKEANPKIIVVMEDMLYTMCTGNQPIPSNHPERYLAALREEMRKRRKPKANRLRWCFRVIAVTAAMFVFALAGDSIFHWQWFAATSTDDEQQYLIQGHEIDVALIQRSIAEHGQDSQDFETENWKEAVDYLGFTPYGFSEGREFRIERIRILSSATFIRVSISYSQENGDHFSLDTMYYQSVENAFLSFEQNKTNGVTETIGNQNVYITSNMNNTTYVWIKGSAVLSLLSKNPIESPNEIITEINGGIEDE